MTALLAGLAGAGGLWIALAAASPAAQVNTQDRAAIEAIVREYILTHPEILPEAMRNLESRETKKAVEANRKAIETPFGNAWAGNPKGDVTLVEFFDYGCGYCRASVSDVERLIAEDGNLKIVFRELPILGADSVEAAKLGLAVATQGKDYLRFHKALYNAGRLTPDTIKDARKAAGIDLEKADQKAILAELTSNMQLQQDLQISGTPGWVVGDRVLNGAVGYDALKAAIADVRAARK